MMLETVHVWSRAAIETERPAIWLQDAACISITGWTDDPVVRPTAADLPHSLAPDRVLRLEFDDVRTEGPQLHGITWAQAAAILDFVDQVKDGVRLLVVHCDAGISRSAAVARYVVETHPTVRVHSLYGGGLARYNPLVHDRLKQADLNRRGTR